MFRSANPTLSEDVFRKPQTVADLDAREAKVKTMTVQGTVNATGMLLGVCSIVGIVAWNMIMQNPGLAGPFSFAGLLGFGLAMVISFVPKTAPYLGFVYAGVQGLFLAGISYFIAGLFPNAEGNPDTGMIFQAVLITFAVFAGMLVGYKSGLIRIGGTMAKVIMSAVIGVVLYAAVVMIGNGLLGANIPNLFDPTNASPISIGFSVVMLGLAALMLVLDFQFIEGGAKAGAPKYMEWYGAFGLLVTLVWLYVEALRLLAKLRSGD